jgi:signal peptidase II
MTGGFAVRRGAVAAGGAMALAVFAADQASKAWILHGLRLPERGAVPVLPKLLDLVMVWNRGVTFGLLQAGSAAGTIGLTLVSLAIVGALLTWLVRTDRVATAAAIGAITGGACGNILDRFRHGMVVDFVHLHWGGWDPFPYVFNLGDSAIVLGVGFLLLEGLVLPRKQVLPPEAPEG